MQIFYIFCLREKAKTTASVVVLNWRKKFGSTCRGEKKKKRQKCFPLRGGSFASASVPTKRMNGGRLFDSDTFSVLRSAPRERVTFQLSKRTR